MPHYRYTAKKGPNQLIEDTIEAQSREEAVQMINRLGLLATQLVEVSEAHPKAQPKLRAQSSVRIKSRDLTILTRQLGSLLKSGVPILRALAILSEQTENATVKQMFEAIRTQVKEGKSFSVGLQSYPRVFSSLYIAMIRAGEDSGHLEDMLFRIAEHRSKQEEAVGQVRSALAYPILMFVTGIGTVGFMLAFVLPRMSRIFTTLGQELPLPTQIVLGLSAFVRGWGWVLVLGIVIIAILVRRSFNNRLQRKIWSAFTLKLPLIGKLARWVNLSRFCRTLQVLIHSGIPILPAIDLAVPIVQNEILKEELAKCHKELEGGAAFGKSLKKSKLFPPFMTNLIGVGEESGHLDEVLAEIAGSYERDISEVLKMITALFEPLMILVMGLIVGFIVVAMLLPVFEMNFMVT